MIGLTELVANIALLIILAWAHGVVQTCTSGVPSVIEPVALGLLHGAIAVASMQMAIEVAPGLFFDGRSVIIAGAGAYGGTVAGLLAGLVAAIFRLWVGGPGAVPGVLVIATAAAAGVAVGLTMQGGVRTLSPAVSLAVGLVLAATVLLWTWMLLGSGTVRQVWLPVLLVNGVGYALLSLVLGRERRQRLNELALGESERKFRAVFDQTFQFTVLLTPFGRVTEANQAALRMAGGKAAGLIGRDFWDTPWWYGDPGVMERIRQAVLAAARGEVVRQEIVPALPRWRSSISRSRRSAIPWGESPFSSQKDGISAAAARRKSSSGKPTRWMRSGSSPAESRMISIIY